MICVLAVVVLVGWSPFEAGPGTLSFRAVAYTRPTVASALTFIVPAFAIGWRAVALAEPVGPGLVEGSGSFS
jgi:hypothetical protein